MTSQEQASLESVSRQKSNGGRQNSVAGVLGRVVTLNSNGILRFWQLSDQTLLRELQYPESCEAELSPDRQHLALASFSSVALINVNQPDQFAMQSLPGRHGSVRLAFSPSGQRLVVSPINKVYVLEVATGEVIHSGSLPFAGANRAIKSVSEDMQLVDHAFLYDFESQTFPWIFPDAVERLSREETTARLIEVCKRPDLSRFASEYALPKKLQRTPVGPPVNKSINPFGRSRLTDQGWQNE